ncbi:MAG: hypothetical protein QM695_16435 [Micropruina sp.]
MMEEAESAEVEFVRKMRAMRLARDWSQERLAAEVNRRGFALPASAITKLEWQVDQDDDKRARARGLRLSEAVAIATALDVVGLDGMTQTGLAPFMEWDLMEGASRVSESFYTLLDAIFDFQIEHNSLDQNLRTALEQEQIRTQVESAVRDALAFTLGRAMELARQRLVAEGLQGEFDLTADSPAFPQEGSLGGEHREAP